MAIDLRGTTRSGIDGTQLASAVQTVESAGNPNAVSSAGAKGLMQVMPNTSRDPGYGITPSDGTPADDARVGTQYLGKMTDKYGVHDGLIAYNWGPGNLEAYKKTGKGANGQDMPVETQQYVGKVSGALGQPIHFPGQYNNHEPYPTTAQPSFDPSTYYEQGYSLGPQDVRRGLGPQAKQPKAPGPYAGLQGQKGDATPTGSADVFAEEAASDQDQTRKDSYSMADRAVAGFKNNSLMYPLIQAFDRQHTEASPEWAHYYGVNSEKLDGLAQSDTELNALRASTSQADYNRISTDIQSQRQNQYIQYSGGNVSGTMYGLAGGIADPAGWVAGFGVGKAFEVAGIGARSLYLAGRMGSAVAAHVGESALANVAVTAGLDVSGDHQTISDYAKAAMMGAGIGAISAPLSLRGRVNTEIMDQHIKPLAADAEANLGALHERAVANVGEGADIGAVSQEMRRIDAQDVTEQVSGALKEPAPDAKVGPAMSDEERPTPYDYDALTKATGGKMPPAPGKSSIAGPSILEGPEVADEPYHEPEAFTPEGGKRQWRVKRVDGDAETYLDGTHTTKKAAQAAADAADKETWANMDHEAPQAPQAAQATPQAPKPGQGHVPDDWLTIDPAMQKDLIDRHGLDAIPDEGTRAMAAEYVARAEKIVADQPINTKALKTVLQTIDMESTSNTLLSSDNTLAKAWAITMLENPQGAAGRRSSAALDVHVRQKIYLKQIADWDRHAADFRKGQGVGIMRDAWDGSSRKEFNRRIYAERENRQRGVPSTENNPHIQKAADLLDRGYDLMRRDAQQAKIVGNARLGDNSKGYQPHRLSAGKAALLLDTANRDQRRAIAKIISRQLMGEDNSYKVYDTKTGKETTKRWDKAFADEFSNKYLMDAARKARGGWDVPLNLHDPQSADAVFDTMKAMNLPHDQADKLLGKFSRGGAQFTKGRLHFDLHEAIPDGKGGTMQLMDLFNQDGLSLYRGYSRRMAGEVALANRGIMGKKGLEVYREGMLASGADVRTLRAYDQTAAELMNTPFGDSGHKFMDNMRVGASLLRLGGMGFTQLGEYGNAIAAIGVGRTLEAIGGMRRLAKEVGQLAEGHDTTNAILKSMDNMAGGLGVTEFHMSRLFDVPDNDIQLYNGESLGIGTRLLRAGSNLQAGLSGHKFILGAQVRGMSEAIARRAMEYAKSGKEDRALDDIGIDADLRGKLAANLDKIATFKGSKLDTFDIHAGELSEADKDKFVKSILRGSSQIIQHTFTGESGKWAHNGTLKILTQFRTFGITSIEKQWGRNVASNGGGASGNIKAFGYLIGAMSFAAPITMARLQLKTVGMSRADREDYLAKNLTVANLTRATMNYASASGVAGDIFDVGNGFAGGWLGNDYADGIGLRGQGQGGVEDLVPALGAVNDLWKGTHGNPHKLIGMVPGSTLPFIQPALNAVSPPTSH